MKKDIERSFLEMVEEMMKIGVSKKDMYKELKKKMEKLRKKRR